LLPIKLAGMRNSFLLLSSILICNLIFAQQPGTKEYLLEKSKKQKTAAWVLLGIGTAAVVTGLLIESPHRGTDDAQSYTGGALEAGGIICCLTSIPFFISSSKKKRRAATLTISNQKLLTPQQKGLIFKQLPTIALKVPLNG
jgi:HD-like signal output (HDOD) protein